MNLLIQGGRVIDPSTPSGQTTSEGQSYGLFYALVANDRDSFARAFTQALASVKRRI